VDIGCGSGKLTIELLTPLFSKVYALDVIRRVIPEHPKIEYIEVPSRDYSVHGVSADSVDFVFSLGCFCHLTNSANQQYLHNIHRVLKPGGRALLIYANCPNNPAIPADRVEHSRQHCRESATANAWCYMDRETLDQLICATKFRTWINVFPEGRDLVALLCKE
jgi:SAM-dependent methyltransferase